MQCHPPSTGRRTRVVLASVSIALGLAACGGGGESPAAGIASAETSAAGIASAIPSLGFILGPVAGTWLYQVNPHYPYVLITLILLPACVGAFRIRQHVHIEP